MALIDFKDKIKVINCVYIDEISLYVQKTDISIQKVDIFF